jgi:hypothetical protein
MSGYWAVSSSRNRNSVGVQPCATRVLILCKYYRRNPVFSCAVTPEFLHTSFTEFHYIVPMHVLVLVLLVPKKYEMRKQLKQWPE